MRKPAISAEYRYDRLGYPVDLNYICPLCGAPVDFLYPDDGKMVFRLDEIVYQVVELYTCTNPECEMSTIAFNPTPRYDYGGRRWGIDVLRFIAGEFLPPLNQKPEQILIRLQKQHPTLQISLDSIARICDDVLLLKAFEIDHETIERILKVGYMILGFDGQDGDGIGVWAFMDLISGRVLATAKFDSIDFEGLHAYLESFFKQYPVQVLGWVSDKQGLIVKCHDTYYADIPHQYCQYHFIDHLWEHLVALDSKIFMPLKKGLEGLYIHKASASAKVFFEGQGQLSPRVVFKEVDQDFQAMGRARNKPFKTLRGEWLFSTLETYLTNVRADLKNKNPAYRFTKISQNMVFAIQQALDGVRTLVSEVKRLHAWFEQIRHALAEMDAPWQEIQQTIDKVFKEICNEACRQDPSFNFEVCKSFLPNKKHNSIQVLGEWCRLWNSYLPGLFKYTQFLGQFRTNNTLEESFSQEKQMLVARVGRGLVGHMIQTRGEAYLRLTHCDPKELEDDWEIGALNALVRTLREDLQVAIHSSTQRWRTMSREYCGFHGAGIHFYPLASDPTEVS